MENELVKTVNNVPENVEIIKAFGISDIAIKIEDLSDDESGELMKLLYDTSEFFEIENSQRKVFLHFLIETIKAREYIKKCYPIHNKNRLQRAAKFGYNSFYLYILGESPILFNETFWNECISEATLNYENYKKEQQKYLNPSTEPVVTDRGSAAKYLALAYFYDCEIENERPYYDMRQKDLQTFLKKRFEGIYSGITLRLELDKIKARGNKMFNQDFINDNWGKDWKEKTGPYMKHPHELITVFK